ncbi:MAG: DMT family transporter [Kiloniellales bacterium]
MPRLTRLSDLPYLLLLFPPLFWAGNVIVGRAVRGEIPPLSLNWWRWSVATLILLVVLHRPFWRQRMLLLRHWRLMLLLAATGFLIFHSAVYIGLTETTALNAALIIALGPVLIVPLAWAMLGERATGLQLLGVAVSCVGAAVVITRGELAVLTSLAFNRGDLWLLLASACWAVYSVMLKRKPPAMDGSALLVAITLLGAVLSMPFYLWEMARGLSVPPTWESAAAIGYVSVFAGVLANAAWNRGIALVGPNKAGLFLHLIPVYTVVLASLFLGEQVRLYHLGGVLLIVLGIVLTTRFGPKAAAALSSAKTR